MATDHKIIAIHTQSDTVSGRVQRLQAEARSLIAEHVRTLEAALGDVERISAEIAKGGELYPPGVRDIARRLADEVETKAQAIEAIMARAG